MAAAARPSIRWHREQFDVNTFFADAKGPVSDGLVVSELPVVTG
jgi:hypothetical protein